MHWNLSIELMNCEMTLNSDFYCKTRYIYKVKIFIKGKKSSMLEIKASSCHSHVMWLSFLFIQSTKRCYDLRFYTCLSYIFLAINLINWMKLCVFVLVFKDVIIFVKMLIEFSVWFRVSFQIYAHLFAFVLWKLRSRKNKLNNIRKIHYEWV